VGECFFWYRLTRVVPDKGRKTVIVVVVIEYLGRFVSDCLLTSSVIKFRENSDFAKTGARFRVHSFSQW